MKRKFKSIIGYTILLACMIIPIMTVAAFTLATTGKDSVGAAEVQILADKFQLSNATAVSVNEPFELQKGQQFSLLGSNYAVSTLSNALVYKDPIPWTTKTFDDQGNVIKETGSVTQVNQSVVLKFPNAAIDANGGKYDIEMTLSGFSFRPYAGGNWENRSTENPIALLGDSDNALWMGVRYSANEDAEQGKIGAKYHVSLKLYKAGTSTTVSKKMPIVFNDVDTDDALTKTFESGSGPSEYTEAITITSSGVTGAYATSTTKIKQNGNTLYAGPNSSNPSDKKNDTTGSFSLQVNSGDFSFDWAGSRCLLSIETFDTFKVTTGKAGQYQANGSIDQPDNAVLWKETKKIVIKPASTDFVVSKVTVDGTAYTNFTSGKFSIDNTTGNVTYTFDPATKDHNIVAEFAPKNGETPDDPGCDPSETDCEEPANYKITYNANGGTGTMDPRTATRGDDVTLDKNKFTRTGYKFIGWEVCYKNKSKCESGTLSDQEVIAGGFDGDVVLKAKWENNSTGDTAPDVNNNPTIIDQITENPKTGMFLSLAIITIILCGSGAALVTLNKKGYFSKNDV